MRKITKQQACVNWQTIHDKPDDYNYVQIYHLTASMFVENNIKKTLSPERIYIECYFIDILKLYKAYCSLQIKIGSNLPWHTIRKNNFGG